MTNDSEFLLQKIEQIRSQLRGVITIMIANGLTSNQLSEMLMRYSNDLAIPIKADLWGVYRRITALENRLDNLEQVTRGKEKYNGV